ncbi:MAG: SLC13 family permease [Thermodesulfobacteriota bacterium]|nr:SLC13 family permease [Thermodesulfobacteriota bacterium]
MTVDIALVLAILAVSVVFLVTEWIPMEAVALLTLGTLAVSGLLSPSEALSGFSNPAVVTVWAVFILSGALTRTGVATVIGRYVLRVGGRGEILLSSAIMISAGVMSAFMNNVAVAALMLPVIMDIAHRTGHPPSRLLMPLAYGSLLGGLTTLIGTPPNILVSDALRDNGLTAFTLFDYTPVGVAVMGAGVAFMVLVGRHLLPKRDVRKESSQAGPLDLRKAYDLEKRMFLMRLPEDSELAGKSLAQTRLRSLLGLNVVAITLKDRSILAPSPSERLRAGDVLVVEGKADRIKELMDWRQWTRVREGVDIQDLFSPGVEMVEARLAPRSSLTGRTLNEIGFRRRFGVNVLATRHETKVRRWGFQDEVLASGTILLLQGMADSLEAIKGDADFDHVEKVSPSIVTKTYRLHERLLTMEVPAGGGLAGKTLGQSRLGDALGMWVLAIVRQGETRPLPEPEDKLLAGDRLIVLGTLDSVDTVKGLVGLTLEETSEPARFRDLESQEVGLMEAMLSPHTNITGKTLRQLRFREKYDLTVLAIWREGKAILSDLRDLPLRFGDALLLHGKRTSFSLLGQDPDFLVLTQAAQEAPRLNRMKVSLLIFAAVILSVVLGLLPIHIAAVIGSALMVVAGCVTMEEAYRHIEWKAVFLIAGMLPLGVALDKTGAARLLAEGVVSLVGPFGPLAVMAGIVGLTFLATCFVPTAALVVLMAPIALKTSADMAMSPHALMMAVAMAASASFITPVSHPANVLVMGPGGYRFLDYVKLGLPLTLVVYLVVMIVVPLFWPLLS